MAAAHALVTKFYEELWNKWRVELVDEILSPDIGFRGSIGAEARGRDEFREYVARIRAAFPDFHNQVDGLIAEGDRAAARLTYTGSHRGELFGIAPTGACVTYTGFAWFTLRDGLIAEAFVLGDREELKEQLLNARAAATSSPLEIAVAASGSEPPLGVIVSGPRARLPERTRLDGRHVTVVPLDPIAHGESLYAGSCGPGTDRFWRYLFEGPFPDRPAFDAHLRNKADGDDPLCFAILEKRTNDAVGYACYMRMKPSDRVIEVGSILFTPRLQRSAAGTEAMYLMAKHAFEDLGYRRYEWKCNALNAPSRSAAVRLGFVFEGIFRQHMIIKGRNRDTAWYSMLDSEWPARKEAFERWLDPANFDADGRQRRSLAECRGELTSG
jgi:steroid delta-isomerase-like uncharacterized protein